MNGTIDAGETCDSKNYDIVAANKADNLNNQPYQVCLEGANKCINFSSLNVDVTHSYGGNYVTNSYINQDNKTTGLLKVGSNSVTLKEGVNYWKLGGDNGDSDPAVCQQGSRDVLTFDNGLTLSTDDWKDIVGDTGVFGFYIQNDIKYVWETYSGWGDCAGILGTRKLIVKKNVLTVVNNQYKCYEPNNPSGQQCTQYGGFCGDGIIQDGTNGTINANESCDPAMTDVKAMCLKLQRSNPSGGDINIRKIDCNNSAIINSNKDSIQALYRLNCIGCQMMDCSLTTGTTVLWYSTVSSAYGINFSVVESTGSDTTITLQNNKLEITGAGGFCSNGCSGSGVYFDQEFGNVTGNKSIDLISHSMNFGSNILKSNGGNSVGGIIDSIIDKTNTVSPYFSMNIKDHSPKGDDADKDINQAGFYYNWTYQAPAEIINGCQALKYNNCTAIQGASLKVAANVHQSSFLNGLNVTHGEYSGLVGVNIRPGKNVLAIRGYLYIPNIPNVYISPNISHGIAAKLDLLGCSTIDTASVAGWKCSNSAPD
ncbi:MAG: hypothetical protein WCL61_04155, partial [bacterium]